MPIREAAGRDALRSQKEESYKDPLKCQAPHGGDAETAPRAEAPEGASNKKMAIGTARCVIQNGKIAIVPSIKKRHDGNTVIDSRNRLGTDATRLRCRHGTKG